MFLNALLLILGVFACSTAVIMIKASRLDPLVLAAARQLAAALILLPLFVRDLRAGREATPYGRRQARASLLPGVLLGVHFITWIVGARMTLAAHASLIVNMAPVVMPFLLLAMTRERINRGELVGTLLALGGLFVLGHADLRIEGATLRGDAVCFVSMLVFAVYLVLGRRSRTTTSLWLYVTPLYAAGGLFCLVAALPRGDFSGLASEREWLLIAGLAAVPTVIGHTILNHSMRVLRGQVVAIVNLGQFIFAGVMAFAMLRETPSLSFYPAALLVVAGAVLAIRAMPSPGDVAKPPA